MLAHRHVNNSQAYQAEVVRTGFDNTSPNHRRRRKENSGGTDPALLRTPVLMDFVQSNLI